MIGLARLLPLLSPSDLFSPFVVSFVMRYMHHTLAAQTPAHTLRPSTRSLVNSSHHPLSLLVFIPCYFDFFVYQLAVYCGRVV